MYNFPEYSKQCQDREVNYNNLKNLQDNLLYVYKGKIYYADKHLDEVKDLVFGHIKGTSDFTKYQIWKQIKLLFYPTLKLHLAMAKLNLPHFFEYCLHYYLMLIDAYTLTSETQLHTIPQLEYTTWIHKQYAATHSHYNFILQAIS